MVIAPSNVRDQRKGKLEKPWTRTPRKNCTKHFTWEFFPMRWHSRATRMTPWRLPRKHFTGPSPHLIRSEGKAKASHGCARSQRTSSSMRNDGIRGLRMYRSSRFGTQEKALRRRRPTKIRRYRSIGSCIRWRSRTRRYSSFACSVSCPSKRLVQSSEKRKPGPGLRIIEQG